MSTSVSVKQVPEGVARGLRNRARRNRRSLQQELLLILEEAALAERLSPAELHRRVRALGLRTPSESKAMVREDRDAR
jgi:plasmid stability protein